ncbi:MAG: translation initiation factor IF-2 N-terminal domain-containing protein, partial [Candidatus Stygibacter australis]|nr:translation initiation factor IF-2 N-terminal domain-containing protein [Candidatus Stygibacter australis]
MAIRVRELAKEFKISSSALMKHLKDMGVDIKSPMSKVEDDIELKIRARFNAEKAAVRQRELDRRNYQEKIVQTRNRNESKLVQMRPQAKPTPPRTREREETPAQWVEHPTKKEPKKTTDSKPQETQRQRPPRRTGSSAPERTMPRSTSKPADTRGGDNRGRPQQTSQNRGQDTRRYNDNRQSTDRRGTSTYTPRNTGDRSGGYNARPPRPGDRPSRPGDRPSRPGERPSRPGDRPQRPGGRPRPGAKPGTDTSSDIAATNREIVKKEPKKKKENFGQKDKHLKAKIRNFKQGTRKSKIVPTELEEAAISKNIKRTLASNPKKKKYRKEDKNQ